MESKTILRDKAMFFEDELDINEIFAIQKDKLEHALHGQICKGDDSDINNLTYVDCSGAEARWEINAIFDSVIKCAKYNIAVERGLCNFLYDILGADTMNEIMKIMIEQKYIEKEVENWGSHDHKS